MKARLHEIARWLGVPLAGTADPEVRGISTDSRRIAPGEIFLALRGPRFDGHAFAAEAVARGGVAVIADCPLNLDVPVLRVADTLTALGRLAGVWRTRLGALVVALTGSAGKTGTKEMLARILGAAGEVQATRGNLNNAIGLPLSLLAADAPRWLVLEMGANHPGEIAALSRIARPDLALLLNAGRAHLEGFGSIAGVARAKGEIVQGLARNGLLVFNADDPYADLWRELAGTRETLGFGLGRRAQVRAEALGPGRWDARGYHRRHRIHRPQGTLEIELPLPGRHNLMNTLAAVAAASALGVDDHLIAAALAGLRAAPGRLEFLPGRGGAWIIDDSYNANPESVAAALEVLADLPGRRWLVLGDMAELGPGAPALHHEVGVLARKRGIHHLWTTGPLAAQAASAFGPEGRHFPDAETLAAALETQLGEEDRVLVKGSRAAAMERVVRPLREDPRPTPSAVGGASPRTDDREG